MMGDALVNAGILRSEQLQQVLKEQKRTGMRFGEVIVNLEFMTEVEFARFLASRVGMECLDLSTMEIQEKVVKLMDEETIRRLRAVPISQQQGTILVGMVDPTDLLAVDELNQLLRHPVQLGLILDKQLRQVLDRIFRKTGEIQGLVSELGAEMRRNRVDLDQFEQNSTAQDAPVVKILQSLFEDAVRRNASDIHIEPGVHVLRVRKRVDGVLHEQVIREKAVSIPLLSKLKLMAGLEISERRLSQDGRFSMEVDEIPVDVRMSTLPTQNGESVVMRLFRQATGNTRLHQVGFAGVMVEQLRRLIHKPNGIILVTGPTGSGKTTTLYAALNELNTADKKIITVEDPVEYRMDRINQVQVNNKIGLGFATVLRTILRQDPDIILVGEMRDEETAEIAIRAALTGHLVLSTLHTNDAASTIIRLFEIGMKGYAVAASVLAVLAQRLMRKICPHCMTDHQPTVQELAWLQNMVPAEVGSIGFKKGEGCNHCLHTGYSGRIPVGELLEIDAELANAIRQNDTITFMERARQQRTLVPLPRAGLQLAMQGVTTLEEAIRLSGEQAVAVIAGGVLTNEEEVIEEFATD
ncbi:MAG: Flp pilus assembly complex ATPase component TadA [Magnetococcales bacterium]|nr:Flp pilus assembly complex ATPase component TadA [Magnetococcales bacterium]MBF0113822.1 Flp pilus assembly complex ATPase component TadA [Magnetococcales bacterium]